MACRKAYKAKTMTEEAEVIQTPVTEPVVAQKVQRLLFGVDSKIHANDILQNNLDHFEWITRNKIYPNFCGRNIVGENALAEEEIVLLHDKGCKIAAIYIDSGTKQTEEQGRDVAKRATSVALELRIPKGTAIFLEIDENENVTRDYMRGFANRLLEEEYIPGFKANTDAKFTFDREFSRGMQTDNHIFTKCLIWAVAPSLAEYDRVTTTHLIHPDEWKPFAPSAITRNDIAIWQYGKNCHPINDDAGKETTFNVNLVRDEQVIIHRMF